MTFEFEVELGDMCEASLLYVREAGFVAQRCWSNAAAAAGAEPCVPAVNNTPGFGASPAMPATLQLAAGAAADVAFTGWSSGPVPDWKVSPLVWSEPPAVSQKVKLTLDATMLNNGGTVTAHVAVPAATSSGTVASFFVESSHDANDDAVWPIAVVVQ
jgi:hypothetical protein